MFREMRWAFMAGLLFVGSGLVRGDELRWKRSSIDEGTPKLIPLSATTPTPQKMPVDATESTAKPMLSDADPELQAKTDCRDGKCAPNRQAKEKRHDHLARFGQWLFFRNESTGCTIYPTAYRPPLYAWFPCNQGQCNSRGAYKQPCIGPTTPASPSILREPALPQPVVPKITRNEKPLIPGSSSVLAASTEPKPLAYPNPMNSTPYRQVKGTNSQTESKDK